MYNESALNRMEQSAAFCTSFCPKIKCRGWHIFDADGASESDVVGHIGDFGSLGEGFGFSIQTVEYPEEIG